MINRLFLTALLLILLGLSACQTSPPKKPVSPIETLAVTAEQIGDYATAAKHYLELAEVTSDPEKSLYYLKAAQNFWLARQPTDAHHALSQSDRSLLSPSHQIDAAIVQAQLDMRAQQAVQALNSLTSIDIDSASASQQKTILQLQIEAYAITNNWLDKAISHIALAELLTDSNAKTINQQQLWQSLMKLPAETLQHFNPGAPPAIDSGWFSLAYLVQSYKTNPQALASSIAEWQKRYPQHPADPDFYETFINKVSLDIAQYPENIAVLLPESGNFALASHAIQQGILAAYFADNKSSKIQFYAVETDSQTGNSNVLQRYHQAVQQGANLIIGPLDKDAVQILAQAESLPIPVLALNQLEPGTQAKNLIQFGLSPEDDAIAVADYASHQGYQRALILAPHSSWGSRLVNAFNNRWNANDGEIISSAYYPQKQSDFSNVIEPLLSIKNSQVRYRTLKKTVGVPLEYQPRRRQDVDFIFLVARPQQARQLMPQLKFHHSGQLPIIATSHAYTGYADPKENIDLNGLIINDIPWVFDDIAKNEPSYQALQQNEKNYFDKLKRFYALGVDSYRLIPELNQLTQVPDTQFNGVTGNLTINNAGHVHRQTRWATFKNGKLYPLESVVPAISVAQ